MKGIKRVKVIQGAHLLGGTNTAADLWGDDPVHLEDTGYVEMARGVERTIQEMKEEEEMASKSRQAQEPTRKKAKFDLAQSRLDWVRKNVGEAVRKEDPVPWRGRGRGTPNRFPRNRGGTSFSSSRGGGHGGGSGGQGTPSYGRGSGGYERGQRDRGFRGGRSGRWQPY